MGILENAARDREYIRRLRAAGSSLAEKLNAEPPADVGIFKDFEPWEAGRDYAQYSLFTYGGKVGFTRTALTSSEVYPPFSTGTESLYGVRPQAGLDGVFGYEYNMAAAAGMLVREGETVYECTRDIDPMLWPPSQLPGHFEIR